MIRPMKRLTALSGFILLVAVSSATGKNLRGLVEEVRGRPSIINKPFSLMWS